MKLSSPVLRQWILDILLAAGLPPAQAGDAAGVFLRSTLRGVGHHDISFLPQRLDWLAHQGVNPRPELRLLSSSGAVETWEGDRGLGEVCCSHATRRAMELARGHGIGFSAIRNSNHFLAAAPYAAWAAEEGFLALVFSNTDACMAAPGRNKNIIGNNPFGFAVPRSDGTPLALDICMAFSSLGNLKALAKRGQSVPEYWGNDASGKPTTDPRAILDGGAVHPMAEHKGFGLALMVEVLTGVLADGPTADRIAPDGGVNTHNQSVLCFDLAAFGGRDGVAQRVQDLSDRLKAAQSGLRLPGERSREAERRLEAEGIDVEERTAERLRIWSEKLGLSAQRIPSE